MLGTERRLWQGFLGWGAAAGRLRPGGGGREARRPPEGLQTPGSFERHGWLCYSMWLRPGWRTRWRRRLLLLLRRRRRSGAEEGTGPYSARQRD